MKSKNIIRIYCIFVIIALVISLLPSLDVFAVGTNKTNGADGKTYTYSEEDDGTDGPDVSTLRFELTGYGGGNTLGSGKNDSDFTTNTKHGWREFEQNGQKYVVLAAATHEMITYNKNRDENYWFYGAKFDHIHYFHYNDTIQFKFEDESFDSEVYNGIILDSGDAMMFPQHTLYHRESDINMFDVYFGTDGESSSDVGKITGKVVLATTTGTFSSSAGTKSSKKKKNMFVELPKIICNGIGDIIQIALNITGTDMSIKESFNFRKSVADIEADTSLKDEIQVENYNNNDDYNSSDNNEKHNTLRTVKVSNTVNNKQGQKETIFTNDTKIPICKADIYSSAMERTQYFDINFFDQNSTNSSGFWNLIRNFVVGASHIVLYISAMAMLVMIVARSIILVISTLRGIPEGAYEAKRIIDNVFKAMIWMGLIYAVLIGMVFLYEWIVSIITNGNETIYLIRLNVENTYSFNTNIIGYFRYMSESTNDIGALAASFWYMIAEIINFVWFLAMFRRMLYVAGFTIIAPITAIYSMRRRDGEGVTNNSIFDIRNFIRSYAISVFVPLLVICAQRFLMYII